ncbi:TIGR03943 family putative permease subunit [Agathobaculum sp.]|uniref:TIGR03943 family putative permease subunit n=1 Tax=Agathobaculum sp. TaxID=2048138 RepID=UPI002A7F872D|nr:GTP-binding protein [Agathobaculum sp.]MCI5704018.1 outer membrane insertion C- signal [Pseudoflavonifractor sp.]MDY3618922.1 GTP-binding protein [Agathobaculum sp.]
MESIPVYVFTGFLESGKTRFIREILADPGFTSGEKTLLLQCEEGVEELSEDELLDYMTIIAPIESRDALSPAALKKLEQQHKPDRVLVEYNGLWKLEELEAAFPARWELYQIVTTVDASTFALYSNNLGPMMFEHITTADLVVFNRCTDELKDMLYQKNIRAMNPRATIYLDSVDGSSEDYNQNMPLPFDVEADIIDIADPDYGLWYVDAMGNPGKYAGKTVRFTGMVFRGEGVPSGYLVPGRFGMVCCAEDVSFLGFLCEYKGANTLQTRDWVRVTASITVEALAQYRGEGPVLHAVEVLPAEAPAEELVYFN